MQEQGEMESGLTGYWRSERGTVCVTVSGHGAVVVKHAGEEEAIRVGAAYDDGFVLADTVPAADVGAVRVALRVLALHLLDGGVAVRGGRAAVCGVGVQLHGARHSTQHSMQNKMNNIS